MAQVQGLVNAWRSGDCGRSGRPGSDQPRRRSGEADRRSDRPRCAAALVRRVPGHRHRRRYDPRPAVRAAVRPRCHRHRHLQPPSGRALQRRPQPPTVPAVHRDAEGADAGGGGRPADTTTASTVCAPPGPGSRRSIRTTRPASIGCGCRCWAAMRKWARRWRSMAARSTGRAHRDGCCARTSRTSAARRWGPVGLPGHRREVRHAVSRTRCRRCGRRIAARRVRLATLVDALSTRPTPALSCWRRPSRPRSTPPARARSSSRRAASRLEEMRSLSWLEAGDGLAGTSG